MFIYHASAKLWAKHGGLFGTRHDWLIKMTPIGGAKCEVCRLRTGKTVREVLSLCTKKLLW